MAGKETDTNSEARRGELILKATTLSVAILGIAVIPLVGVAGAVEAIVGVAGYLYIERQRAKKPN